MQFFRASIRNFSFYKISIPEQYKEIFVQKIGFFGNYKKFFWTNINFLRKYKKIFRLKSCFFIGKYK